MISLAQSLEFMLQLSPGLLPKMSLSEGILARSASLLSQGCRIRRPVLMCAAALPSGRDTTVGSELLEGRKGSSALGAPQEAWPMVWRVSEPKPLLAEDRLA